MGRSGDSVVIGAEAWLSDLPVENLRSDAIQTFTKQETLFVRLRLSGGVEGLGYSYTIGTGGKSVLALLRESLLQSLIGRTVDRPEAIWRDLLFQTRATSIGAITSLALAAVDTAVWDARCKMSEIPLWKAAGGAQPSIPLYDTEGGWLHLDVEQLAKNAAKAKGQGLAGIKLKVGKPKAGEDVERVAAARAAVGDDLDIMVDANQSLTAAEAIRRAALFEPYRLSWFEEPLPADDVTGHKRLSAATSLPIAVGESLYSVGGFREYLVAGAASIIQVDAARVGGITPWLKVAHLAEACNVSVAPHFLMELHVSLCCAVPNAIYLEHIPQLQQVTFTRLTTGEGVAMPPDSPGLGIDWDLDAVDDLRVA